MRRLAVGSVSYLPAVLIEQIRLCGNLALPEREFRLGKSIVGDGPGYRERLAKAHLKDWRFDLAWPDRKLAVEVEGGGWIGGRHVRGKGFHDDLMKYGTAMSLGWAVYRCDRQMIEKGIALLHIEKICLMEDVKCAINTQ